MATPPQEQKPESFWTLEDPYFLFFYAFLRYKHLIFAYKGYKVCETYRQKLMNCRASLKDRQAEHQKCKNEAIQYLECYHNMYYMRNNQYRVENSKLKCIEEYKKVHACLKESAPERWDTAPEGPCKDLLNKFADCK